MVVERGAQEGCEVSCSLYRVYTHLHTRTPPPFLLFHVCWLLVHYRLR
jgi:hypothetical protein